MRIYLFIDNPDLGENEDAVVAALQDWVGEDNPHALFVNKPADEHNEKWQLGIETQLKNAKHLNAPLNDFYKIAKKYKCDFVVGLIEENNYEDVCYFGDEEGKPDPFEIGCYLGFGS